MAKFRQSRPTARSPWWCSPRAGARRPAGGSGRRRRRPLPAQTPVEVSPDATGMPGAEFMQQALGWLSQLALWGSLASILIGAAVYGLAQNSGNYNGAFRGKQLAGGRGDRCVPGRPGSHRRQHAVRGGVVSGPSSGARRLWPLRASAAFVSGLAVALLLPDRAATRRRSRQRGVPAAAADGPAGRRRRPRRQRAGVPAGFERTEAGAVAAAASFVCTGQALLDMDPLSAEEALRELSAEASADELVAPAPDTARGRPRGAVAGHRARSCSARRRSPGGSRRTTRTGHGSRSGTSASCPGTASPRRRRAGRPRSWSWSGSGATGGSGARSITPGPDPDPRRLRRPGDERAARRRPRRASPTSERARDRPPARQRGGSLAGDRRPSLVGRASCELARRRTRHRPTSPTRSASSSTASAACSAAPPASPSTRSPRASPTGFSTPSASSSAESSTSSSPRPGSTSRRRGSPDRGRRTSRSGTSPPRCSSGSCSSASSKGCVNGDPWGMVRRVAGGLPAAVLGMVVTTAVVARLLELTDVLSDAVLANSDDQALHFLSGFGVAVTGATQGFAAVVIGLVVVLAALLLWIELMIRASLVYLLVAISPLGFAATLWPSARGFLQAHGRDPPRRHPLEARHLHLPGHRRRRPRWRRLGWRRGRRRRARPVAASGRCSSARSCSGSPRSRRSSS